MAAAASGSMRTYHWSVRQRLDHGAAAIAARHHQPVRFGSLEQALRLELGDDALARLEAIQPAQRSGAASSRRRVGRKHVDQRQTVALPDRIVVEIVGRA